MSVVCYKKRIDGVRDESEVEEAKVAKQKRTRKADEFLT